MAVRKRAKRAGPLHRIIREVRGHKVLLDLDDYPGSSAGASDEFLLDIDLDDVPDGGPVESAFPTAEFVRQAQFKARAAGWSGLSQAKVEDEVETATPDQLATTQEIDRPEVDVDQESAFETSAPDDGLVGEPTHSGGGTGETQSVSQAAIEHTSLEIGKLSPELIDAIARRAVAQLSEKIVQEIAWEVVPQLAELLIKRQLEEKNS